MKKRCSVCRGKRSKADRLKVAAHSSKTGGGDDLCVECYRKQQKDKARTARMSNITRLILAAKLTCPCGLKYKAGHIGFSLAGINLALCQIYDYGINRKGEDWVLGNMMSRGIYCKTCEKTAGVMRPKEAQDIGGTRYRIKTENPIEELPKPEKKEKGPETTGQNWWDGV